MKYNNYFFKVLIFFLIFVGAFHAYSGVLSIYLFYNEYLNEQSIFSYEAWREYVSNSSQFLLSKFLVNLDINLNNDFHFFSIFFLFGLVGVYYVNKIILEFLGINDFYERTIIVFCILFSNSIVLKSVNSAVFPTSFNIQTALAIQLIYPLIYFSLSKKWILASIISSLMIITHFVVAWFPVTVFSFFLILKNKLKNKNILLLLIPILAFISLYIVNKNLFIDSSNNTELIEEIFLRSHEENKITLQPINRLLFFIITFFIFFKIKKKVFNKEFKLYLDILFYTSLTSAVLGTAWSVIGYKILPMVELAYLYWARSMLNYNIVFNLLLLYFISKSNFSILKKTGLYLGLYTIGKTFLSLQGILIAFAIIIFSIILDSLFKLKKNGFKIQYKEMLICFLLYFFVTNIYHFYNDKLELLDSWSIKNLNTWTQGEKTFIKKNDNFKNKLLSLRKCDDFVLISINTKSGSQYHDKYYNYISHKSNFIVDNSMYFYNYDLLIDNKKKTNNLENILQNFNKKNTLEKLFYKEDFEDVVFLFDNKTFFIIKNNLDLPKNNIINLGDDLIFVSKNILIKKNLKSCIIP